MAARHLEPGSFSEQLRPLGPPPAGMGWGELYGTPSFDTAAGWEPVRLYLQGELSHSEACAHLAANAREVFGSEEFEPEGLAAVELTCWPEVLHESALAEFRHLAERPRPGLDLAEPEEWALALEAAERVAFAAWASGQASPRLHPLKRQELGELLAQAQEAIEGESGDDEHDALYALADAVRELLEVTANA